MTRHSCCCCCCYSYLYHVSHCLERIVSATVYFFLSSLPLGYIFERQGVTALLSPGLSVIFIIFIQQMQRLFLFLYAIPLSLYSWCICAPYVTLNVYYMWWSSYRGCRESSWMLCKCHFSSLSTIINSTCTSVSFRIFAATRLMKAVPVPSFWFLSLFLSHSLFFLSLSPPFSISLLLLSFTAETFSRMFCWYCRRI